MNYREGVHTFGSQGSLVGIVTEPAGDAIHLMGTRPAIIVSNVGLNHRTGPNRVWVELARRMASKGFVTLRFDMDGLGDSAVRPVNLPDAERYAIDMREAVDFVLKKARLSRVALVGLCSGVDAVHAVAAEDGRVSAALFLDGYNYPTFRHLLNRKFFKAFDPRHYLRRLRLFCLRRQARQETGFSDPIFVREYPSPQKMRQDVDVMLSRGTRLYFAFTGGFSYVYSYRNQFFDMLPGGAGLRGKVRVEMFPLADHLFSGVELKEQLYRSVEQFLMQESG